jgi:uncharacterized glyoxalase superfamily metalloenzyme YdcJ
MTQALSHTLETQDGENYHRTDLVDQDDLRTDFTLAMSAMYKQEVPLYGDLVQIVREVNQAVIENTATWDYEKERLDLERHGAIRLGSPQELRVIRRVFALIGLYPVGYYDLSVADLPMHATAFRPVSQRSLARNPFRVFTTILRPELLEPRSRHLALSMISRRKMFTDELLGHIGLGEAQGGFTPAQASSFIQEALKTFRWQHSAACSFEDYQALKSEHPILADISCFVTAHINHLTPRTLDIDHAYTLMKSRGLKVKVGIEGPPRRSVPVLLRQTSFLALEERTCFSGRLGAATVGHDDTAEDTNIQGTHKARFGEIEQRGAAVTPKGRSLYDAILAEGGHSDWSSNFNARLPDDWNDLLEQRLVYCLYRVKTTSIAHDSNSLAHTESVFVKQLLNDGVLEALPQTYEDFLPVSAAGIFRSNLSDSGSSTSSHLSNASIGTAGSNTNAAHEHQYSKFNRSFPDQDGFEEALGCKVMDPYQWYAKAQEESLQECSRVLGLAINERV